MSYRAEKLKNGVTFDFEVKFDLEGHGQSPPKTIGILTKVFYTYGPNLVILAWTGDELSHGQASDYCTHGRTDGRTHRQTQATTIPEGQNWPRVKMHNSFKISFEISFKCFFLWPMIIQHWSMVWNCISNTVSKEIMTYFSYGFLHVNSTLVNVWNWMSNKVSRELMNIRFYDASAPLNHNQLTVKVCLLCTGSKVCKVPPTDHAHSFFFVVFNS